MLSAALGEYYDISRKMRNGIINCVLISEPRDG